MVSYRQVGPDMRLGGIAATTEIAGRECHGSVANGDVGLAPEGAIALSRQDADGSVDSIGIVGSSEIQAAVAV